VLLVNLGTPDAPETPAVRRYLAQFLMDPRVIDVNVVSRALLVYGAVLPFRPAAVGRHSTGRSGPTGARRSCTTASICGGARAQAR
jgi:protoheme ferro-lyase